jgi:hypothetical protein
MLSGSASISKPEVERVMTMFQIWLRSEETGATDTVIYIKAESIDTAFDYCNRFRPLLCAKSCFPEGWWIEDDGAKLFSTEEMLEIIDGMEEAA